MIRISLSTSVCLGPEVPATAAANLSAPCIVPECCPTRLCSDDHQVHRNSKAHAWPQRDRLRLSLPVQARRAAEQIDSEMRVATPLPSRGSPAPRHTRRHSPRPKSRRVPNSSTDQENGPHYRRQGEALEPSPVPLKCRLRDPATPAHLQMPISDCSSARTASPYPEFRND
jgi:hypothetical protein